MGLLIVRLLTLLNTAGADSIDFHIAQLLLKHYSQINQLSIAEMANLINVSKSTMSKFAKKIGFDDYHDLKDNAIFVEDRYGNKLNYLTNIEKVLEKGDLNKYFNASIQDIKTLQHEIDERAIDNLAKNLVHYDKIAAFGLLFSESAALDFQYKLAYNGKFIYTCQEDLKQLDYIRHADKDSLIIVFSNSGNFIRQKQLIPGKPKNTIFKNTSARLIAITADPAVKQLSYIYDAIVFPHETTIQTHALLYQIVMDLIIARYRYYASQK